MNGSAENRAGYWYDFTAPGANSFTPDYVLPVNDILDITDSVTLNGGLQSPADTVDITDSVTATFQNGGTFEIDHGLIGFSDIA